MVKISSSTTARAVSVPDQSESLSVTRAHQRLIIAPFRLISVQPGIPSNVQHMLPDQGCVTCRCLHVAQICIIKMCLFPDEAQLTSSVLVSVGIESVIKGHLHAKFSILIFSIVPVAVPQASIHGSLSFGQMAQRCPIALWVASPWLPLQG